MADTRKLTTGTDAPANGAVDKTILAAPGAGKIIRVKKIILSVIVAAAGGGGVLAIEDGAGGSRFVEVDADAVVAPTTIDFGEEGYPLTANTVLNATVDGAATTQATARVTAIGVIVG